MSTSEKITLETAMENFANGTGSERNLLEGIAALPQESIPSQGDRLKELRRREGLAVGAFLTAIS